MSNASISALEPLIGFWKTTIEMTDETGAVTTHHATDTYRRGLGGRFVLHDVAGEMAGQKLETLEILSPGKRGAFDCRSYDNTGAVADYTARIDGDRWSIRSDSLKFDGGFSEGGRVLSGVWKQKRGGKWHLWLSITLRKQAKAGTGVA